MLKIEEVTNKFTQNYHCPDDINNLKIRIKLRSHDDDFCETTEIGWQEKLFSRTERDFYKDASNCLTDIEKSYHEQVKDSIESNNLISTYINHDNFELLEKLPKGKSALCRAMECLSFDKNADLSNFEYNFEKSLQKSIDNPLINQEYELMYIVADFGEFYDNVWLKSEYVLCALKYNKILNLLIMKPDFNQFGAYIIKINTDTSKKYEYSIENASLENVAHFDLLHEAKLFDEVTLYDKKLRFEKISEHFSIPPLNKLQVHLMLQVECAKGFERANIYVEYQIELPENWNLADGSVDALHGITPSCAVNNGKTNEAYFGIPFEITLEYNVQSMKNADYIQEPFIYFQVISKDTWSRYRTEGLTYRKLPIWQPGIHQYNLNCLRITSHSLQTNLRRFFIGDCYNYKDVSWLAVPKHNNEGNVMNKYGTQTISTGNLLIKMQLIHQSQAYVMNELRKQRETSRDDDRSLLMMSRSVQHVLDAFKRTRMAMLDAREKLLY